MQFQFIKHTLDFVVFEISLACWWLSLIIIRINLIDSLVRLTLHSSRLKLFPIPKREITTLFHIFLRLLRSLCSWSKWHEELELNVSGHTKKFNGQTYRNKGPFFPLNIKRNRQDDGRMDGYLGKVGCDRDGDKRRGERKVCTCNTKQPPLDQDIRVF